MIASLRKRHVQAWLLISLVLIILVPAAVISIPDIPFVESGYLEISDKNIIYSAEKESLTIRIVEGTDDYLVILELKDPLKSPASFFYAVTENKTIPIKRAGAAGQYVGRVRKTSGNILSIEIQDDLDHKLIHKIELK